MNNDNETVESPFFGGCGCGVDGSFEEGFEGVDGGYDGGNVFADSVMARHLNDPDAALYGTKAYMIYSSVVSGLFIISLMVLILLIIFDGNSGAQTVFGWMTGILLCGILGQDIWHKIVK